MADVREDILARLEAIAGGIVGIATVVRNASSIDDLDLPAIVVMDADEQVMEGEPATGKPNYAPVKVIMTPEILIKVSGRPEDVGGDLNDFRAALIKAVLEDTTLAALATNGGRVKYLGCSTQLGVGRAQVGEMAVAFGITYVLRPPSL